MNRNSRNIMKINVVTFDIYKNSKGMILKVYNKFLEANGRRDTSCDPEVLKKYARPNKKIRFSPMIASVGCSQCVHANGFSVLKLVATMLDEICSTLFHYFACSVNSALLFTSQNQSIFLNFIY